MPIIILSISRKYCKLTKHSLADLNQIVDTPANCDERHEETDILDQ